MKMSKKLKAQLLKIAMQNMVTVEDRGNLDEFGCDSMDFIEVPVWGLEAALLQAYELGVEAANAKHKTDKRNKVEWCENFIKAQFTKHHAFSGSPEAGIEASCFWKMAEASGLWERGTYGSPMSEALSKLTKVEPVQDDEGNYLYSVFKLK